MKQKQLIFFSLLYLSLLSIPQAGIFYIFLSQGQSDMEANARICTQDSVNTDRRFQAMEAVDGPSLIRLKSHWHTAAPLLYRCRAGLTPADFFIRQWMLTCLKTYGQGLLMFRLGL